VVAICYVACALIWGTTWFVIRQSIPVDAAAVGLAYPPFLGAAIRFTIAGAIVGLAVASGAGRPLPSRRQLGLLIAAGAVNGVGYLLVYHAEVRLPGGLMAVLFGTIPLITAVAATALKIEKVTRLQVVTAAIALAGIAIIFQDALAGGDGASLAAALCAVLASVTYSILVKRASAGVHPLAMTAVFLITTALVCWVGAIGEGGALPWPPPPGPTLATLYLALFGSVIAFACYFYLLRQVSLMVANSLVLVQPVIALLVDAGFEAHASLAPRAWVGIAVTLAAVALNLAAKARALRARPPEP
jgi:drug/metabolite transporter (DMT)-like permease